LQHALDHTAKVVAVAARDPWVLALDDLFVQTLHVLGLEGRAQRTHFVQHAA